MTLSGEAKREAPGSGGASHTLQLNIAGRAPGQFDVLNVTGTASLNGNLRLLNLGYQPANGDKLQLITAGGVVSGRFSAPQNPFTLAVGFDTIALVYARNSVTLEFFELHRPVPPIPPGPPQPPAPPIIISITDYASCALTLNQKAIGAALNAVQLAEKDPALVDFLASEPFANLPRDLDKLSPESLSAIDEISFSAANVQTSNLEQRFAEIRNGSNGFSSSLNLSNAPLRIQSKSQDSLRSNVGLSASYTTKIGKVTVTPSVRASWQHEYAYSALPVTAQFGGGVGEFTVYGPSEGQDSAIVNAGVNLQWTPTIGTYFGYNGQLGRSNEDSQGGTCSMHWDF